MKKGKKEKNCPGNWSLCSFCLIWGWVVCHEWLSKLNINTSSIILPHEWYIKHAGFTIMIRLLYPSAIVLRFRRWANDSGVVLWGCIGGVFYLSLSVFHLYRGNQRFLIHFQAPRCLPQCQMGDCLVYRQQETQESCPLVSFCLTAFQYSKMYSKSNSKLWSCMNLFTKLKQYFGLKQT